MAGQGFDASFRRELAIQSWIQYGIGVFIIVLRTFARWQRIRSFRHFAVDDWLMITAVPAFYTTLIVCLNTIASGGGSNLYPPEQYDTFTPLEIKERIKGSKIVVVSEQAMLNVIWTLKVCMLFMYARMTDGTRHLKFIKYLAIYVAVGWMAVEIAFFTACRPFKGYWGMPPPNPQCTTLEDYAIVQAVFNLSSDAAMILIPIPMILSLNLPLKQKFVLAVLFSMGTFVIVAAILTKVYNLSDVYDTAYMLWYTREASVAVYVANLPGIWPLLREHIRFLRTHASYPQGSSGQPKYGSRQYGTSSRINRSGNPTIQAENDEMEMEQPSFSGTMWRSMHEKASTDEEERIGGFGPLRDTTHSRRGSPDSDEQPLNEVDSGLAGVNLEVHVDKTVEVQRKSWDVRGPEVDRKMGLQVTIQGPGGSNM